MSIRTHDYEVRYSAEQHAVVMQGSLRLNAAPEYQPISDLMDNAVALVLLEQRSALTLDLRELKFLNSSGINLLYQFVLKVKKQGGVGLQVLGSNANAWQPKSLSNMVKFMPTLELVMT
jgi:hypothetical protein